MAQDVMLYKIMNYITVHPFIFSGRDNDLVSLFKYDERKEEEQIRRRYNDLYLPIDEFINKYLPRVEEK